jgi:hypothetical protein
VSVRPDARRPKEEKKVAFTMSGHGWKEVFRWLAEETKLPVAGDFPQGSLSFTSAPGQKYTIPDIIDIINRGLIPKGLILVRQLDTFIVTTADAAWPA